MGFILFILSIAFILSKRRGMPPFFPSWARCPCHKGSRRFSFSAACIRKEMGESKAKHPSATEIQPHPKRFAGQA